MPFPFPNEILLHHLVPLLETEDIVSLFSACNLNVPAELYNRLFLDHTQYDHYDAQMLLERSKAKVYAFGDPRDCRFGDRADSSIMDLETIYEGTGEGPFQRVGSPFLVKTVGEVITKVCARGPKLAILNSRKDLYITTNLVEQYAPNRPEDDFIFEMYDVAEDSYMTKVRTRTTQGNDVFRKLRKKFPQEWIDRNQRYYRTPRTQEHHFVDANTGEACVFGLDDTGLLWEIVDKEHTNQPIPFFMVEALRSGGFDPSRMMMDRVLKLRSSSSYFACLVENRGICFWNDVWMADGWRKGYPCNEDHFSCCEAIVVPGTADDVVDFAVLGMSAVYLTDKGRVEALSLRTLQLHYHDRSYDPHRVFHLKELNDKVAKNNGGFVQISGSDKRCVLVAKDGSIFVGEVHWRLGQLDLALRFYPELREKGVATAVVGNHHALALTKQGEVYSWVTEDIYNGCLGLGGFDEMLKLDGVVYKREAIKVDKPHKVKLPGKAYGVFAGEDYSAVLVYTE